MTTIENSEADVGLEFLRPLGTFERFRAVLHDLGFHYSVALAAQYSHGSCDLDLARLFDVLVQVVGRHPALSITIRGSEGDAPYFAKLKYVELNRIVHWIDIPVSGDERDAKLDQILSAENSKGFDVNSSDPLWRIVVLETLDREGRACDGRHKKTDLIFVWHHAIGDGYSGLAVLHAILEALDKSPDQNTLPCCDDKASTTRNTFSAPASTGKLAPALESLLVMPSSIKTKIRRASLAHFGDWSKKSKRRKWSGGIYQNTKPIKTLIQHIRIAPAELYSLKQRCRLEKTTMTAFLQTLLCEVILHCVKDAERLMCATAISLRRFFPPRGHNIDIMTMGMWVSAFHAEYISSGKLLEKDNFDWDSARNNRKRISDEIAKGETDVETGALRNIADFKKFLLDKIGEERQDSFAVTNLGIVKSSGGGILNESRRGTSSWNINDIVFSQSCHVNGSAIQFCIISTDISGMVICLSSQEGVVAQEDLDQIAQLLSIKIIELSEIRPMQNPKRTPSKNVIQ